jgi:hypothetical protein
MEEINPKGIRRRLLEARLMKSQKTILIPAFSEISWEVETLSPLNLDSESMFQRTR